MEKYNDLKDYLENKRIELGNRLEKIRKSKRKPHDKSFSEQAVERENDDVVDSLGESIMIELEQIDNALKRLKENKYSLCESCGGDISEQRLNALPYTSLCIDCANLK